MYQHVTTATRFRINQNPNILDLVLTNEEHMIPDGVTTESPLGASDHRLLSFSFRCYTKQKPKSHTTLMYHKADYESMSETGFKTRLGYADAIQKHEHQSDVVNTIKSMQPSTNMFHEQNLFSLALQRENLYGCHTKH